MCDELILKIIFPSSYELTNLLIDDPSIPANQPIPCNRKLIPMMYLCTIKKM